MLCRLLGNKEGRGPLCGRTGNESGTKLGQYSSSVGCWRVRLYVSRKRARRVARSMRDLISAWLRRCNGARVPGFTTRLSVRREWVVPILFRLGFSRGEVDDRPIGWGVVVPSGVGVMYCPPSKGRLSGAAPICGVEYVGRQKVPLGVSTIFATLWRVYGPVVAC